MESEGKCRLVPLDDSILTINTTKGLLRVWQEMNTTMQASRKDPSCQVNHRCAAAHIESYTAAALLVEPAFDLRDVDLYLRWCFEASVWFCMNKQRSLREVGFITAMFRHAWTCDAPVNVANAQTISLICARAIRALGHEISMPHIVFLKSTFKLNPNKTRGLFLRHLLGEKCSFLSIKSIPSTPSNF